MMGDRGHPDYADAGEGASLRMCISTTAIVSDNPRLDKEADALAAAVR